MKQELTMVICAHDRPQMLRDTLRSLRALRIPTGAQVEILVIVSPNKEATWAAADDAPEGNGLPIRKIRAVRTGLSSSRNLGLAEAQFDYVVYFDEDVEVNPDWLAGFFDAAASFQADCVVGPVSPLFEIPVPEYLSPGVLRSILSPYTQRGDKPYQLPQDIAYEIPGCNLAVRKSAALEAGGFDPQFGYTPSSMVGGDDFEFGKHLAAAGKRIVYEPRCAVGHWITADKLNKSWFQRRWYGNGVWSRRAQKSSSVSQAPVRRIRALASMGRMAFLSTCFRLMGRPAVSFEWELKARSALGYYRGK